MEVYASHSPGIGGRIRQLPEDFIVEEVLTDGSKAEVQPSRIEAPVGWGRYLLCVMVKRNWDTLLAVREIAKRLGISSRRIAIAGIKDTKALTAQHISIGAITPEATSRIAIKNLALYPLRFSNEKISSRFLWGNCFHITIRDVPHAPSAIEQQIEDVWNDLSRLEGFPNFFGHQRFGTARPITHVVGKLLVKGDVEKAVLTFVAQPSAYEHPEAREARKRLWDTQDFREALRCFPTQLRYERMIIAHLAKWRRDFIGAFRKLPLKLRRLFVQAYQSYLFNKFLSQRIRRKGAIGISEAEVGDYMVFLDHHGLPTTHFVKVDSSSISDVRRALVEGRMLAAIPLVGFRQPCSEGMQGEIEREILEAEGVSPEGFRIPLMPEICAPGGLRTIRAPVIDFSIKGIFEDSLNPSRRGVNLSFRLHRGAYATVLLREFMKPRNLIDAGF